MSKIGFMQGRLSPMVNGKIQAFPSNHWRSEFGMANELGIHLMEWTVDQEGLYSNPLMTTEGRLDIKALQKQYSISIPSLTGDCFMQFPFWKECSNQHAISTLKDDFRRICASCADLMIKYIVLPLVDNGSICSEDEEYRLTSFLLNEADNIHDAGISILFESDLPPSLLGRFIEKLPDYIFGINYDTGNSASLGYSPVDEFSAYGHRIKNVHIKDRKRNGGTVELGNGDTNFRSVFKELSKIGYSGNLILQSARAKNHNHAECLVRYKSFTEELISEYLTNNQI